MCVDRHEWRVLRFLLLSLLPPCFPVAEVFSSTLLPVLLRPRVISTSLRICHPLLPKRFGVSSSLRFYNADDSHQHQISRASLGKTYSLTVSRPALQRFVSYRPPWLGLDIGTRLLPSARSTPLYHIAGSLFATYTDLSHASSPRDITANAVALLMSSFRPERRTVFSFLLVSSHQDIGLHVMPGTQIPRATSCCPRVGVLEAPPCPRTGTSWGSGRRLGALFPIFSSQAVAAYRRSRTMSESALLRKETGASLRSKSISPLR